MQEMQYATRQVFPKMKNTSACETYSVRIISEINHDARMQELQAGFIRAVA